MMVFPIIIDSKPAYLNGHGSPTSLALTPCGAQTLLDHLRGSMTTNISNKLRILCSFAPDEAYRQTILKVEDGVTSVQMSTKLDELLTGCEPSDWLLMVDPRRVPIDGSEMHVLTEDIAEQRFPRYLVALEADSTESREFVELDGNGRVSRVQRYYAGVTWLHTSGVACALLPVASARVVAHLPLRSLTELRKGLAAASIPGHDIPLSQGAFDLESEAGLLSLTEHDVYAVTSHQPPPNYSVPVSGVWMERTSRIAPGARIYGPVIIQEGVVVEPDAAIIGPALIGADAHVKRDAIIAQSLVLPRTHVAAGTKISHRVIGESMAIEAGPLHFGRRTALKAHLPCSNGHAASHKPGNGKPRRGVHSVYPLLKRLLDAGLSLFGLVALSPLLLVVAAMVKLTSRGPVLYGDLREGKGGKVFRCWKFRTMIVNAHSKQRDLYAESDVDGPQFKLKRDPRLTSIGGFLRASNLDELPQLINVLLGQMSLIGPRPSPFRENQICVSWRQARLSVQPGITGLWQICRHERSAGDFHQWIQYDTLYVRHMSLALDLKILLATILTLGGRWTVSESWLIPPRELADENRPTLASIWETSPGSVGPQTGSVRKGRARTRIA